VCAETAVLELVPAPSDPEWAAAVEAVSRSGVDVGSVPAAYGSRWRAAGIAEAVEREPGAAGSPEAAGMG
jgi:hypothetical protein